MAFCHVRIYLSTVYASCHVGLNQHLHKASSKLQRKEQQHPDPLLGRDSLSAGLRDYLRWGLWLQSLAATPYRNMGLQKCIVKITEWMKWIFLCVCWVSFCHFLLKIDYSLKQYILTTVSSRSIPPRPPTNSPPSPTQDPLPLQKKAGLQKTATKQQNKIQQYKEKTLTLKLDKAT